MMSTVVIAVSVVCLWSLPSAAITVGFEKPEYTVMEGDGGLYVTLRRSANSSFSVDVSKGIYYI